MVSGTVHVGRLTGLVHIRGALVGNLEVIGDVASSVAGPAITVGVPLGGVSTSGQIRVGGSLYDEPNTPVDIFVNGVREDKPFLGAIAIDWDGYQPSDRWNSGGVIAVGDTNSLIRCYQGDHPPEPNDPNPVYEISCQKGDANNDWAVTFDDINPFVVALSGQAEYEAAFPGLGASWQYHSDCNCDQNVDFDDLDAFVLRLTDPNEYFATFPDCELCPGEDNMGQSLPNDPESIATMFRTYVAQDRLAGFIERVRGFVEQHADTPRGRFWAAVLRHLD